MVCNIQNELVTHHSPVIQLVFWFQDWNLTWYTSRPHLTQCFQHTVLAWFPCVYLWICSPIYLLYLQLRPHRGVIPLSKLCCSKTVKKYSAKTNPVPG